MTVSNQFARQELNETLPPVPDHVIAAIHRATPQEALNLARLLPEPTRSRLALFCFSKSHLREAGCAIAMACTDSDLVRQGAVAGQALIQQRALSKATTSRRGPAVTVATPASQHLFQSGPLDEDEEDAA